MGKSKIDWTDRVWNPVTGCTKISEGCKNCYAERMSKRLAGRAGYPAGDPFKVTLRRDRLEEPLRWKKPRKIFVCSMADLFHDDVTMGFISRVFSTIRRCPQHTFIMLTKRPARMGEAVDACVSGTLPNLWLGVTAENQETADLRIPILLKIPAAKRFVSIEPMLGPVDLYQWLPDFTADQDTSAAAIHRGEEKGLDWVICGGESGPGARPMHPDWARSLRDQCKDANVPFFFKQWGEWEQNVGGGCARMEFCRAGKPPCQSKTTFCWPEEYLKNVLMMRVGKKAAGHLLDGKEHRAYPEAGK